MKKALFIVILISVVMLVGVPKAMAADPTDSISVNVSIESIAVSVEPGSWDLEIVAPGVSIVSPELAPFIATNLGNVNEDFNISSNGTNWTCASSGLDLFLMEFNSGLPPWNSWAGICSSPGPDLAVDLAPTGTASFGLRFSAPTAAENPGPESITVTVTASKTT